MHGLFAGISHGKLKAQLIRSHHCCRTLIGRGLQISQRGLGSSEDTARLLAWDNRTPPLPAAGPLHPPGQERDFDIEHGGFYEEIILFIMENANIENFKFRVREITEQWAISWTRCRVTLQEVRRQIETGIQFLMCLPCSLLPVPPGTDFSI